MVDVPIEWLQGTVLGRQEVAAIFNVAPETVAKWAKTGMIGYYRKPNGTRCYPESEIRRLAASLPAPPIVAELLAQERVTQAEKDEETGGPTWMKNPVMRANYEKARERRENAAGGKAA